MQVCHHYLLDISRLFERALLLPEETEEGRRLNDPRRTRNLGRMLVDDTISFLLSGVNADVLYCGFKHFVLAVMPSFLGEMAM